MAVRLNNKAYNHARGLVQEGKATLDERDAWSEHRPSAAKENAFLREHGLGEYQRWYLGIDDEQPEERKGRYKYPYGDFETVHRCGVLSAESRAAQYDHHDVQVAVAHLHGMLEELRAAT